MIRQHQSNRLTQPSRIASGLRGGHDVPDQSPVTATILTRDNDRLRDPRLPCEHRLDLARLDAESPDLDLVIDTADE
ncbi:hypothetical protein SAMN04489713_128100, partial [Actinomadura madurae]